MNTTMETTDQTLMTFEILTGALGFLFIVSEFLGKSKCKANTIFDLFLECINKMSSCTRGQESQINEIELSNLPPLPATYPPPKADDAANP